MSYRIPFPKTFISLNTPAQKADGAMPAPEVDTAHSFLSNRPDVPRHSSISSESSTGSIPGASSSPPTRPAESPVLKSSVPAFLALNSKYDAPPTSAKEAEVEKTTFLSNKA